MVYPSYSGPSWSQDKIERFFSRTNRDGPCWEWTGSRIPNGYGNVRVDGINQYAHRVSYTLAKGPILEGRVVTHSCDNPTCINPNHLFMATQSDNCQQREGRMRRMPGRRQAILDRNRRIANDYESGATLQRLADVYSLSTKTVYEAVKSNGIKMRPPGRPRKH